jgi:hypothetical protein
MRYQRRHAISGNPSARRPGARPQGGREGEGQRGRKDGQVRSSSEAGKVRKSAVFWVCSVSRGNSGNSAARQFLRVVIECAGTAKVFLTTAGSTLERRHARYGSDFAASLLRYPDQSPTPSRSKRRGILRSLASSGFSIRLGKRCGARRIAPFAARRDTLPQEYVLFHLAAACACEDRPFRAVDTRSGKVQSLCGVNRLLTLTRHEKAMCNLWESGRRPKKSTPAGRESRDIGVAEPAPVHPASQRYSRESCGLGVRLGFREGLENGRPHRARHLMPGRPMVAHEWRIGDA